MFNRVPAQLRHSIYELDAPDDVWMRRILRSLVDSLDLPGGVYVREGVYAEGPHASLGRWWHLDTPFDPEQLIATAAPYAGCDQVDRWAFPVGPHVGTLHEWAKSDGPEQLGDRLQRFLRAHGLRDLIALTVAGTGRSRLLFAIPFPTRVELNAGARRFWTQVATHMSVASRLRAASEAEDDSSSISSEVWNGLLRGEWEIVDSVDAASHRVVLASPAAEGRAALSARERDVVSCVARGMSNKSVAYHLGLSTSTVATHLRNGLGKLQIKSRVELVQLACYLADESELATEGVERRDNPAVDFDRLEGALTFCAQQIAILDNAGGDHSDDPRVLELRQTLRALQRLLPSERR